MRRREALCAAVQTALRAKGRPFMNYERAPNRRGTKTVSYTHLTLPTNREV